MLPALDSGGVERGTVELGRSLAQRGHRSLVMSAGGRLMDRLTTDGSDHLTWPVGSKNLVTLRLVRPLRRLLRDRAVDVLHLRSRVPAWIGYLAWRGMPADARPRLVTTVHGLHSVSPYSAIMTRGEAVIAVSHAVRQYILDNYPRTEPDRITVVPRGIDPQQFPFGYQPSEQWLAQWHEQYPALRDRPTVVLPGRLTRLKGHRAFFRLMARLPHAVGLVVGGVDPRRQRYARQLRAEAPANVIFTGHRSDMREIFAVSDLVLSLSTKPESFGRTVLEALSVGTPVAGYDHGGVGEVLAEVYPPGLVTFGDESDLLQRAQQLLESPPAVPREHEYSLQRMLDGTVGVYEALLAERA
jgi:glycosyltransferase involved in cell wall biosynthesis